MSAPTDSTVNKVASEISDLWFWFFIIGVALVFMALSVRAGFREIHDDLDRSNKIECIKLRESGVDSLGPIDREACPYDMGGGS